MATVIEALEEMIVETFRHRAEGNELILREDGQNDYRLGVGVPHFAMRIDLHRKKGELDATLPFLRLDRKGLTKKCDLIVFVPDEERLLVFLIEMKSLNATGALMQMLSSREFARYLVNLMKLHKIGDFEPEFRGVLIRSRRIPAKTTSRLRDLRFETGDSGLPIYECDRSRPLSLRDLVKAA